MFDKLTNVKNQIAFPFCQVVSKLKNLFKIRIPPLGGMFGRGLCIHAPLCAIDSVTMFVIQCRNYVKKSAIMVLKSFCVHLKWAKLEGSAFGGPG